jgi:hypothetical protein
MKRATANNIPNLQRLFFELALDFQARVQVG